MNPPDIILILLAGGFAVFGFLRGFIREVFDIAGLIGGAVLAVNFAAPFAVHLPPSGWSLLLRTAIAAIAILVLSIIAAKIIAAGLRLAIIRGPIRLVDRVIGAVFGTVKGAALGLAAIVVFSFLPGSGGDKVASAPLSGALIKAASPFVKTYRNAIVDTLNRQFRKALAAADPKTVVKSLDQLIPYLASQTTAHTASKTGSAAALLRRITLDDLPASTRREIDETLRLHRPTSITN